MTPAIAPSFDRSGEVHRLTSMLPPSLRRRRSSTPSCARPSICEASRLSKLARLLNRNGGQRLAERPPPATSRTCAPPRGSRICTPPDPVERDDGQGRSLHHGLERLPGLDQLGVDSSPVFCLSRDLSSRVMAGANSSSPSRKTQSAAPERIARSTGSASAGGVQTISGRSSAFDADRRERLLPERRGHGAIDQRRVELSSPQPVGKFAQGAGGLRRGRESGFVQGRYEQAGEIAIAGQEKQSHGRRTGRRIGVFGLRHPWS